MSEWIRTLRGGLLFDTATFARLARQPEAMLVGAILVVAVALLANLPAFIISFANGVQSHPTEAAETNAAITQALAQAQPFLQNLPPEVAGSFTQGLQAGGEIEQRIAALPTALPRPLGAGLRALGGWLSKPFAGPLIPLAAASLATWLGYGIWVVLAGKLLGGRADLAGFFGATALYAGPHLLGVFGLIPYLGPIFGLVAFFWGLAIYVKATAVSQELTIERSLLAVLLPAIVAALLLLVLGLGLAGVIIGALAGGR